MSKVLIMLADGFEDTEFTEPYMRLLNACHEVTIIGTGSDETITGKCGTVEVNVQQTDEGIGLKDYDALVIPGGYSPDHLRMYPGMVNLAHSFMTHGKLVAAICHGPQVLIEADVVSGRTVTSWPSVRTDLVNAGAHWVDQPVVEDDNLITSRKPEDLDEFCSALLDLLDHSVLH
jgi:protease I